MVSSKMSDASPIPVRSKFHEFKGLVIAVLAAAGLIYLLMGLGSVTAPVKPDEKTTVFSVAPGSDGQLQNGKSSIPVAVDEELLPDLIRATTTDPTALVDLGGRIFYVEPQTSVRVSETGAIGTRVRVLTGPQKGRIGWVPSNWVKPV
jgi:hypothetical protein